jgi:hypothetical protein
MRLRSRAKLLLLAFAASPLVAAGVYRATGSGGWMYAVALPWSAIIAWLWLARLRCPRCHRSATMDPQRGTQCWPGTYCRFCGYDFERDHHAPAV